MDGLSSQMIFHGSVILVAGLLCGAPMGSAIKKERGDDVVRAWRVAHSGLLLGAVLLFAIALILPSISVGSTYDAVLAWSFILSAYGFLVALPFGATIGNRGLQPSAGRGQIVYFGNLVGAGGSLLGGGLLVWASFLRVYP